MTTTIENTQAKYITTKRACEILDIKKPGTLYGYIKTGKLKAYKIGGDGQSKRHWRIKPSDLEAFITGNKAGEGTEREHTESNKQ